MARSSNLKRKSAGPEEILLSATAETLFSRGPVSSQIGPSQSFPRTPCSWRSRVWDSGALLDRAACRICIGNPPAPLQPFAEQDGAKSKEVRMKSDSSWSDINRRVML